MLLGVLNRWEAWCIKLHTWCTNTVNSTFIWCDKGWGRQINLLLHVHSPINFAPGTCRFPENMSWTPIRKEPQPRKGMQLLWKGSLAYKVPHIVLATSILTSTSTRCSHIIHPASWKINGMVMMPDHNKRMSVPVTWYWRMPFIGFAHTRSRNTRNQQTHAAQEGAVRVKYMFSGPCIWARGNRSPQWRRYLHLLLILPTHLHFGPAERETVQ